MPFKSFCAHSFVQIKYFLRFNFQGISFPNFDTVPILKFKHRLKILGRLKKLYDLAINAEMFRVER